MDPLPSQIVWLSGDHGPLRTLLSYLSPTDSFNVSLVCTATSSVLQNERLWYNYWPWIHERPFLKSLLYVPSYKYAMQLQSLYFRPIIQSITLDYQLSLLQDVTCPLYIGDYRVYGYSNGTVRVFGPLHAGSGNREYALHSGSIRHMQLIPESNKLYVGSWKGRVHSIDLITGTVKRIVTIEPERLGGEPVYGLRIISGDRLCTCSGDGIVRVYNIRDGNNIGVLEGHTGAITDLVAATVTDSPSQGKLVNNNHNRAYSSTSSFSSVSTLLSRTNTRSLSLTPSSSYIRLVSSSYDGTLRVWDLRTMSCVAVLEGHHGPIWSIAIIHNNVIVSSSADGTVRIWYIWENTVTPPSTVAVSTSTSTTNPFPSSTSLTPLLSSKCIHVLSPYTAVVHKQIWCIKIIGNRIFMGCSDGAIHCYSLHIDMDHILTTNPISTLLWTYNTGINHSDGIRRMDVVKEYVYTCTKYGNVGIFKMSSPFSSINDSICLVNSKFLNSNDRNARASTTGTNTTDPSSSSSSSSFSSFYGNLSIQTPERVPRKIGQVNDGNSSPLDEETTVPSFTFFQNILLHNNNNGHDHSNTNKTSPTSSTSDTEDTLSKLNDSTSTVNSSPGSSDHGDGGSLSEYRYRNNSNDDDIRTLYPDMMNISGNPDDNNKDKDKNDTEDDYFPSLASLVRTGTGPCSTHYKSNSVSPNDQERDNIITMNQLLPIISASSSTLASLASSSNNIPTDTKGGNSP